MVFNLKNIEKTFFIGFRPLHPPSAGFEPARTLRRVLLRQIINAGSLLIMSYTKLNLYKTDIT